MKRIRAYGRGHVFANSDFRDISEAATIRWNLHRLEKERCIRRLLPGIYDFPAYSHFLQETLAPDIHLVAQAISRKFGWHIQLTGSAALYYFGLSTQVPGRSVFCSDGPSRCYKLFSGDIEFRHISRKESLFKHPKSGLLVQALREWGKRPLTQEAMDKINACISADEWPRILRDTGSTTQWIHSTLLRIHRNTRHD